MMTSYQLCLKSGGNTTEINLDKDINDITGQHLALLGIDILPKYSNKSFLTISKERKRDNEILWKITNSNFGHKKLFLYSSSRRHETQLKYKASHYVSDISDLRISLNEQNSRDEFLFIKQNKTIEVKGTNRGRIDADTPITLNFEDIEQLLHDDPNPSKEKKEEILDEDEIDKIFKEYNKENIAPNKTGGKAPIQNDESKGSFLNDHNTGRIKDQVNVPVSKAKIICDDEEEGDIILKRPMRKILKPDDEFFITESQINEILSKYGDDHTPNKKDSVSREEDYHNRFSKFAELNSNNKRNNIYGNLLSDFKSKRLKKATDNKELKIGLNTPCAICLEDIKELANLDKCSHDFCKQCIIRWSKFTNLCPLCKVEFKKIFYYEKCKKLEIKVKRRKFTHEDEEYHEDQGSSDECMVCQSSEDTSNLLVCDECGYNVCHTYCDGLDRIPEGDWFCLDCRRDSYLDRIDLMAELTESDESFTVNQDDDDDEDEVQEIIEELRHERRSNRRGGVNLNVNNVLVVNITQARRRRR